MSPLSLKTIDHPPHQDSLLHLQVNGKVLEDRRQLKQMQSKSKDYM